MTRIEDIEKAAEQLSPGDLARFRAVVRGVRSAPVRGSVR
jgi:hypothetical protein